MLAKKGFSYVPNSAFGSACGRGISYEMPLIFFHSQNGKERALLVKGHRLVENDVILFLPY